MVVKIEEENADYECSQRRSLSTRGVFKVVLCCFVVTILRQYLM